MMPATRISGKDVFIMFVFLLYQCRAKRIKIFVRLPANDCFHRVRHANLLKIQKTLDRKRCGIEIHLDPLFHPGRRHLQPFDPLIVTVRTSVFFLRGIEFSRFQEVLEDIVFERLKVTRRLDKRIAGIRRLAEFLKMTFRPQWSARHCNTLRTSRNDSRSSPRIPLPLFLLREKDRGND